MNSRRLQGASAEHPAPRSGVPTPAEAGSTAAIPEDADLAAAQQRYLALRLVESEAHTPCQFWVGLTRRGSLEPPCLLDFTDVTQLLDAAAMQGTSEEAPLMLSDTELSPPRFVYLLPLPEGSERASWMEAMVTGLTNWSPEHVGFYLPPEVLATADVQELLQSMLRETLRRGVCREIYLLVGRHGLNTLVNTALRLKADLEQEQLEVVVFH